MLESKRFSMKLKRILLTGATDGIGLETAKLLASSGHHLLLHGRSSEKLDAVTTALQSEFQESEIEGYLADLSDLSAVEKLATEVLSTHQSLDVLINNAGVFVTANTRTPDGVDVRFVVNSIAPYVLTKRLLSNIPSDGRVINLSSAAQSPVDLRALTGQGRMADGQAYAQSKLAITMWTNYLATHVGKGGPSFISVNPGSFLGSKMVREAYGQEGKDLSIGANILVRAALSDDFANANGQYFDNDSARFASPHPDALNPNRCEKLVKVMDTMIGSGPV